MTRIRNKTLKKIFDSGNNLTPAKWGRAIDVMYPTPDEGKDKIINTTYQELVDMIASNELIPGAQYQFEYNSYLPIPSMHNTNDHNYAEIVYQEDISYRNVIVTAVSTNSISNDALYEIPLIKLLSPGDFIWETYRVNCNFTMEYPYKYNLVRIENDIHLGNNVQKLTENHILYFIKRFEDVNSTSTIKIVSEKVSSTFINYIKEFVGCDFEIELDSFVKHDRDLRIWVRIYVPITHENYYDDLRVIYISLNSKRNEVTKSEDDSILVYNKDQFTGFVYNIKLPKGFLSYDISALCRITESCVFVGNIKEDHYVALDGGVLLTIGGIYNSQIDVYPYIAVTDDEDEPLLLCADYFEAVDSSYDGATHTVFNRVENCKLTGNIIFIHGNGDWDWYNPIGINMVDIDNRNFPNTLLSIGAHDYSVIPDIASIDKTPSELIIKNVQD